MMKVKIKKFLRGESFYLTLFFVAVFISTGCMLYAISIAGEKISFTTLLTFVILMLVSLSLFLYSTEKLKSIE